MADIDPAVVFDGHIDTLMRMQAEGSEFLEQRPTGHVDLPRARAGRLGGAFCAVYIKAQNEVVPASAEEVWDVHLTAFDHGEPETLELGYASSMAIGQTAILLRVERASSGDVKVVRTAAEIESCLRDGVFAALLHLEGAEPIDLDLNALDVFYGAGLRSLGVVHSRPNSFGHGVPFTLGQSPDSGPGLTDAGQRLVRECNRLGVLVDLSHLNEAGFWDVARITTGPLVATHSNAYALCPSPRNLTDRQLEAIRDSEGMVGINFHTPFLRSDGAMDTATPVDVIVQHVEYIAERVGIDHVGLGSDFE
jgi:membrane dipeptidase